MSKHPSELEPRDEPYRGWIFTLPNIICMLRLVGSVALLAVAAAGHGYWFVGLFIALALSDWIDGRLARWLRQRSDFGALLDSFADVALNAALVIGTAILRHEIWLGELPWIAAVLASYLLTTGAGLLKFGRMPSYHTWAAKKSQALVLLAGIAIVLFEAVWPLRLAALAVVLTNVEATLLTWILPAWRADVSSLRKVLADRRGPQLEE